MIITTICIEKPGRFSSQIGKNFISLNASSTYVLATISTQKAQAISQGSGYKILHKAQGSLPVREISFVLSIDKYKCLERREDVLVGNIGS